MTDKTANPHKTSKRRTPANKIACLKTWHKNSGARFLTWQGADSDDKGFHDGVQSDGRSNDGHPSGNVRADFGLIVGAERQARQQRGFW